MEAEIQRGDEEKCGVRNGKSERRAPFDCVFASLLLDVEIGAFPLGHRHLVTPDVSRLDLVVATPEEK
jgi:hypothetical protein